MLVVLLGLFLGIFLGFLMPVFYDGSFIIYMSVGIMASIDSVVGAIRALLELKFDRIIFISGFITNSFIAMFLAFIGDMLGLPLYYCALFVFGSRLFNNLALIRRYIINKYFDKK